MIHNTIQQDIDLWEAWVEFDAVAANCFGNLYVTGEVLVAEKENHPFIIKCVHKNEPQTLVLKIQNSVSANGSKTAEVLYSEPLYNLDQYNCIKIYKGNELITLIEDIEVVI
jgi:hypothetical protein